MADEVDSGEARRPADPTPGTVLRAARKEQGRTTRDIAATLNMDAWMLDAIERDEYSALGAPVFAKGHLRKYAHTLSIDPDDLMVGYYRLADTGEKQPLIADSILRAEASRPVSFAWVFPTVFVAAAVITLAAVALWYLRTETSTAIPETVVRSDADDGPVRLSLPASVPEQRSDPETEPGSSRRSVALPPPDASSVGAGDNQAVAGAAPPPVAAVGAPATAGPRADAAVADEPAADEATEEPEPAAPAVNDNLRVTLRFRTDSWVEVYDAQRRKMLYGMGEAGTTRSLNGAAPLQVFLGRYTGVDIEVNGEPFTIPRAARRTNTARFRIEQPAG